MFSPQTSSAVEMAGVEECQRQSALFVRCSDEKARQREQQKALVRRLPRRDAFLDVGAGGGDLTVPLAEEFQQVWAVEPNVKQAERLAASHSDWNVQNCFFEQARFGDQLFDFVLCSHQTKWRITSKPTTALPRDTPFPKAKSRWR